MQRLVLIHAALLIPLMLVVFYGAYVLLAVLLVYPQPIEPYGYGIYPVFYGLGLYESELEFKSFGGLHACFACAHVRSLEVMRPEVPSIYIGLIEYAGNHIRKAFAAFSFHIVNHLD